MNAMETQYVFEDGLIVGCPVMPLQQPESHTNECEQHSLGWYRSRLGNFTGSCIGKLMKPNRQGGFSDTAMSYIYQVAATRYMNEKIVSNDCYELYEGIELIADKIQSVAKKEKEKVMNI